jgi:hypothetical protein
MTTLLLRITTIPTLFRTFCFVISTALSITRFMKGLYIIIIFLALASLHPRHILATIQLTALRFENVLVLWMT